MLPISSAEHGLPERSACSRVSQAAWAIGRSVSVGSFPAWSTQKACGCVVKTSIRSPWSSIRQLARPAASSRSTSTLSVCTPNTSGRVGSAALLVPASRAVHA
ncbi:hypothetical protein [Phycisphaera mikurensis]|uniref:hypothetical protein n=1 Tax=Phycisphaera mikurensis TaxID=547188 RepID=UPI00059C7415|nr:hypothetical protein [Phycisphaera mikurensis]MBB6441126.1 hypothetical protein [Phycisphaera mikurensis]